MRVTGLNPVADGKSSRNLDNIIREHGYRLRDFWAKKTGTGDPGR
jgi:hypothetical protein